MASITMNTAVVAISKASTSSSLTSRPSLRPLRAASSTSRPARIPLRVSAVADNTPLPVKVAENLGYPTQEGLFGFKPFAELWVGRLAMMGFVTGLVEEYMTGRGILQQIGFSTPDQKVLIAILALTSAATLAGTFTTIARATSNNLTPLDIARYRKFFGLDNEAKVVAEEAKARKAAGDFTSSDKPAEIAAAKAEGTPADAILSFDESSKSPAAVARSAEDRAMDVTWQYAKQVEITNGRYAMLGFWIAIATEAATGHGMIGQVIDYLKIGGFLGPMSGF